MSKPRAPLTKLLSLNEETMFPPPYASYSHSLPTNCPVPVFLVVANALIDFMNDIIKFTISCGIEYNLEQLLINTINVR